MYTLRPPHPSLRPFLEHYWFVEGKEESPLDLSVDVYVDGRADLILPFDGAVYERWVGVDVTRHHQPNLDAQRRDAIRIVQAGRGRTAGVRFHLGGVGPFTTTSLHRFTGATPTPEAVFGPAAGALLARLECERDVDAQAAYLDAWFLEQLRPPPAHEGFRASLDALVAAHGETPIGELAAACGVSVRQLERWFARFLGLPPKETARILRFQRALRMLMTDPEGSLAQVAQDAGYFDQAHFVRDFRRMTGGGVPRGYRGYYPAQGPYDFAPNVVVFVQEGADDSE